MNNQSAGRSRVVFIIAIIVLLTVIGWFLNFSILSSGGGNKFLIQWLAVRSFAKEGVNPYSSVLQSTAEEMVYGHVATNEPKLKFSSPLYSILVILPYALISDFKFAAVAWTILLVLTLLISLVMTLRIAGWKPPLFLVLLLITFTLLGFHNFRSVSSGSVVIIAMFFLYLAFASIREKRYELAGILLALATIQPRTILLVLMFVLFWSLTKRLWLIVVWFFAGVSVLFILGLFFIPDWPIQYLRIIFNFEEYYQVITPVSVFSSGLPGMGRQLGWGLSLIMVIILILEWLAARNKGFSWFLWTASLTLVVSQWIGIPADPEDFVLLLLPFVLVLAVWEQRFARFGKWIAGLSLVSLLFGLWMIFARIFPNASSFQLNSVFLFPFPLFLLISLYWVRWWAVRSQGDYVEGLKSVEKF